MKFHSSLFASIALLAHQSNAFQSQNHQSSVSTTQLRAALDRRNFGRAVVGAAAFGLLVGKPTPSNAEVFFDPAMYGDQELRVGTVDTVRERARRAILQNPSLAPSFYQLALLDGLSYNAESAEYGPNGNVVYAVVSSKDDSAYIRNLQEACQVLIAAEKDLKKKTAVSIADCVAIAGAEAIDSIGGPVLTVQLGRMEPDKAKKLSFSQLPLDLFSGNRSSAEVRNAFKRAGLTEREMVTLLGGLMTLETVEKSRTTEDWKKSGKAKFVERGKMGRMSDYKKLTEEDIAEAALDEFESEESDDGWYIVDSFGTKDSRFGDRIAKDDISEKNFNKYLKQLQEFYVKANP
jgi:hypothetical protein